MDAYAHQEKVKVTIECTFDERMYLKLLAAKAHQNLSEFILSYVRKDFPKLKKTKKSNKKPNKKTLEAMMEIDAGGGIECDSIEDFWEKMGISRA